MPRSARELVRELGKLSVRDLAPTEARAVHLMRAAVAESSASPDSLAPVGHCQDAGQARLALQPLQQALYACFAELGNNLEFEHEGHARGRIRAADAHGGV